MILLRWYFYGAVRHITSFRFPFPSKYMGLEAFSPWEIYTTTPLSRHFWSISLTHVCNMCPYPSCTAVRLLCHFCYCVFEAWMILCFWKLKLLRVSLLCIARVGGVAVTPPAAAVATWHAARLRRGMHNNKHTLSNFSFQKQRIIRAFTNTITKVTQQTQGIT